MLTPRSVEDIDRWAAARRICGCWACASGPMDSICSVRNRAFAALTHAAEQVAQARAEEREACATEMKALRDKLLRAWEQIYEAYTAAIRAQT